MNQCYSLLDKMIMHLDLVRRTLSVKSEFPERPYPAEHAQESDLTELEKKHVAGLMRVNHAGEVCAQALYQGQALTARSEKIKAVMQSAAVEELDHLAWCNRRLTELDSRASYLNMIWYLGALSLGITAGVLGDRWSLAFLAETENQVAAHLESHQDKLPVQDERSYQIIAQMHHDERQHRDMALQQGAATLPRWVREAMRMSARVMTHIAYRV